MKHNAHPTSTADAHPLPETLFAYHADELPSHEAEAVQDHLVGCTECAALILEMAGLAPLDVEELSEVEVHRAWRQVRPRLRSQGVLPRPWLSRPRLLAVAAVVLLAVVAAPQLLRRTEDPGPLLLRPIRPTRGTVPTETCSTLPDVESWSLLLEVPGRMTLRRYEVAVLAPGGLPVKTLELVPADDELTLELARSDLRRGRFRLQLVGFDEGEPAVIEQYCIEVPGS